MYNKFETILTNVAGACIAGAIFVSFAGVARANDDVEPVTMNAINALYVANDDAQRAIDHDVCANDSFVDVTTFGDALTGDAKRQYRIVRDALGVAYDATSHDDESLDIVTRAFCEGVSER